MLYKNIMSLGKGLAWLDEAKLAKLKAKLAG